MSKASPSRVSPRTSTRTVGDTDSPSLPLDQIREDVGGELLQSSLNHMGPEKRTSFT